MGPFVTPFDLLFAVCFLTSVAVLGTALVQAIRGRAGKALRILGFWGVGAAVYFLVLVVVSLSSPQKVLALGEPRCFDDWCLTAQSASRAASGAILIDLRVSSRAKRVDQRAPDAAVFLTDDQGRRWDPAPDASELPLAVMLHPGEAVETARRFEVPSTARGLGLVVNHGNGPANLIIGDEASLFHKRTVYLLPQ